MFGYMNSYVFLDVPANFCGPFFRDKTSESTDIDIFTFGKCVFHFLEHGFQGDQYIHFWNSGLVGNLIHEVCLSHCKMIYKFLILNI